MLFPIALCEFQGSSRSVLKVECGLVLMRRDTDMLETPTPSDFTSTVQQSVYFARMNNVKRDHDNEDEQKIENVDEDLGAGNRSVCSLQVHDHSENASPKN